MASSSQPAARCPAGQWSTRRRPSRATSSRSQERYGLFIGGELVEPRSGEWFPTHLAGRPRSRWPRSRRPAPRTSTSRSRPRAGAFEDGWSALRPAERAKYLFRIARILQERARELAVAESLDGGKPIKESRDVDLPLAAAHFFYHAGWADKLEYAFPNRDPRPLGVAGQIIPWNFPLLMLAWKIAPALACGNTVVLKPAETTPLTALLFADVCRQAELPPGVVNIVTGDGSTGAALVQPPGHRQGRLHRLDRGRQGDPARAGRARHAAHAGARRQGGQHRLRRLRARPGGRGDRQRHLLQPGPRLLRRLAAARAGVDRRAADRQAQAPPGHAPGRRPAGQEHRRRRHQLARPARADPASWSRAARRRGAEIYQPACDLPERGYWFPPTVFTNVAQSYRIAQEEIFGPVLSVLTFRTPDGGGREGQQHALRAVGRASGPRRARASCGWPSGCAPASSGRTRSTASTRPRRSAATRSPGFGREGGRHGLEAYLRFDE